MMLSTTTEDPPVLQMPSEAFVVESELELPVEIIPPTQDQMHSFHGEEDHPTTEELEEEYADLPALPPLPTPKTMAQQRLFLPFVLGGFLLALNAGFLNACFLFGEFRQPVGHVTGTITKVTKLITDQRFEDAWWASTTVLGFFSGSLLSGLLIKKTTFKLRPR